MVNDIEDKLKMSPEEIVAAGMPKPPAVAQPKPPRSSAPAGYAGQWYTPASAQDVMGSGGPGVSSVRRDGTLAEAGNSTRTAMPLGLAKDISGRIIPTRSAKSTIAGSTEIIPGATEMMASAKPSTSRKSVSATKPGDGGRRSGGSTRTAPAMPTISQRYTMDKGTGPLAALPSRVVAGTGRNGIPTGQTQINPYNDSLGADMVRQGMGGNGGDVPGGNVSRFAMSPEQMKEVEARRAEGSAAMDSYEKALDEKNFQEGLHGAAAARAAMPLEIAKKKAFADELYKKWGINIDQNNMMLKQQLQPYQIANLQSEAKKNEALVGAADSRNRKLDADERKLYLGEFDANPERFGLPKRPDKNADEATKSAWQQKYNDTYWKIMNGDYTPPGAETGPKVGSVSPEQKSKLQSEFKSENITTTSQAIAHIMQSMSVDKTTAIEILRSMNA